MDEGLPQVSANEVASAAFEAIYPTSTPSYPFTPRFLPPKCPKLPWDDLRMDARLFWKLRRIAAGYRQQDVAAHVGISSTRYSALERGEAEPKQWEVEAVERLLPPLPHAVLARERVP